MCGICGILHFNDFREVNYEILVRMNQTMIHRGPDDYGIYQNDSIGLAHRRLSIIDLSTGHQPMYNEDGSICIIFNGEIYNHEELRTELQAKGHQFRTRSDTEAIIHCYEEYNVACVERLRGMFAFSIWDANKKKLLLARDRLGIKPLYYYHDQNSIVFASEIKAIFASGYIQPEVNPYRLDAYLTLGYVPGPDTLFKGIYKLLPGHILYVNKDQITIKEYWDFASIPSQPMSESECCKMIIDLFQECVKSHLMSDVPLGVFLSGGIDSSSVVATMAQYVDQVETFSIGYSNALKQNELDYARIIATQFKTKHHEFILEPTDFFKSISELLLFLEEPIVEPAAIALFYISKLSREHVTVLLSGEGADEIFGGYPIYRMMRTLDRLHQMMPFVPINSMKKLILSLISSEKIQKYLDWIGLKFESRYFGVSCDMTSSIKHQLYSDTLQAIDQQNSVDEIFYQYYDRVNHQDMLRKMLYVDTKIWLPDDLLTKADKITMATSVELRVPFLDHKFVEFTASIPSTLKIKGRTNKYIFKKAMKDILPDTIIYRKKRGFPVPINQWFSTDLYTRAADILLDRRTLQRGYFNEDYLAKILCQQKNGQADHSRRIFSLITLELWHQAFIDSRIHKI
jgi:asparagine synthase (glutamine-hydrolysing)